MKRNHNNSRPFRFQRNLKAEKALALLTVGTNLQKCRGVLENYAKWAIQTLNSEGIQAQNRLKAYRDYFETQVAAMHVTMPKKGKYKKLIPLLNALNELLQQRDYHSIRFLNTIIRTFELATPSKKFLEKKLHDFIYDFGVSHSEIKCETIQEYNRALDVIYAKHHLDYFKDSLYYRGSDETQLRNRIADRERKKYLGFPWQEFHEFLSVYQPVLRMLARYTAPKPEIGAKFIASKSPSKIATVNQDGTIKVKSYPNVIMGNLEIIYQRLSWFNYDSFEMLRNAKSLMKLFSNIPLNEPDYENSKDYRPLHINLARHLLSALDLQESYHFDDISPDLTKGKVLKDVADWLDDNFLFIPIETVVIPASNSEKERIIHKAWYGAQYALSLLHTSLIEIASWIPGDYSSSHECGFNELNRLAGQLTTKYLADVDATAWTDHFPSCFQAEVLTAIYGPEVANDWYHLMRTPAVKINRDVKGNLDSLTVYSMDEGQYMGTLSSWATANVSHHMLLRFAYHRAKSKINRWFEMQMFGIRKNLFPIYDLPYFIIGDDEVSADPAAQTIYTTLESSLGIPLNASKSKVFSTDNGLYLTELAHRQSLRGIEVSGVSPKLVCSIFDKKKGYTNLIGLLRFCRNRRCATNEAAFIGYILKEVQILSKKEFARKYGVQKPFSERVINIGLRIPTCVGGLLPDDSDWNTKVDLQLLLVAIPAKLRSIASCYRPGSVYLPNKGNCADEVLNSIQVLPDNLINYEQITLTRYEREVYNSKHNRLMQRHIMTALDTYLDKFRTLYGRSLVRNYSEVDLNEVRDWFLGTIKDLEKLSDIPFYSAREYEEMSDRLAFRKITKYDPTRKKYENDEPLWFNDVMSFYDAVRMEIQEMSHSVFPRKEKKEREEELMSLYENLFSEIQNDSDFPTEPN